MVSAINSSTTSSPASSAVASTAAIEAQLARDRKELSNCVNCETAETKQGQADIQALTNKIKIAEARLKEISNTAPENQTPAPNQSADDNSATNTDPLATPEEFFNDVQATISGSTEIAPGRYVDVFV